MDDATFQPNWFSKPGDTLLTLMEQRELTAEELAQQLGCTNAVVQGVISGAVSIDHNLAKRLSKHVGGTPKFWETRERKYQEALSRVADTVPRETKTEWVRRFPHSEIAKNGWIKHSRNRDELARAYLAYFGVTDPNEWEDRYAKFLKQTHFRTSPTFQSKAGPLSAWLRQGEIEAEQVRCKPWNEATLRASVPQIRTLCKTKNLSYFLPRLQRLCSEAGVAVVFVRAPSGCVASGATQFISPTKAMIILSFRHLSDDHFWFTVFHEIAHLLLHSSELTFIDGEEGFTNKKEKEANEFSEQVLVPFDRRDELLDLKPQRESIVKFAYSIGVSPGIVVGQMQHHGLIKRKQMNYLKRRYNWADIESAVSSRGNA
ncbi:ImmA/IrrE family metallo-endopeptidase [Methyloceanibacter methanicus]|uniref:ImmA/IrrE family metallo-endopeptidase n=1 Tax=Methyloceanibacter methanicus TaxID=1774968 RepID=UPI0009F4741F|nr:ImmA/IrrE family metallo-endopeptidase [Methyloceanibacter methanicus]